MERGGTGRGREGGVPNITGARLFLRSDLGQAAQTSSLWAVSDMAESCGLPRCLLVHFLKPSTFASQAPAAPEKRSPV